MDQRFTHTSRYILRHAEKLRTVEELFRALQEDIKNLAPAMCLSACLAEYNTNKCSDFQVAFSTPHADLDPQGSVGIESVWVDSMQTIHVAYGGNKTFVFDRRENPYAREAERVVAAQAPGECVYANPSKWIYHFRDEMPFAFLTKDGGRLYVETGDRIVREVQAHLRPIQEKWADVEAKLNALGVEGTPTNEPQAPGASDSDLKDEVRGLMYALRATANEVTSDPKGCEEELHRIVDLWITRGYAPDPY